MPSLNERDFAKLAAAAAQDLVDNGIPLKDSVDKIASRYDMNDEQLRRLCEASNNAAFNALFEKKGKTGSEDRLVDFDVAKPAEILRGRIDSAKTAMAKTASAQCFDAAWESRPLERAAPLAEKTASAEDPLASYRAHRDRTSNARSIDKALSHLRHEKIAAELEYTDTVDKLYRHFRAMDHRGKFGEFEKDAMVLHGQDAEGTLDSLRKRHGLPMVNRNYGKIASRVVVSDRSTEHQFLKKALAALEKVQQIQATLTNHSA